MNQSVTFKNQLFTIIALVLLTTVNTDASPVPNNQDAAKIQMAILLDTSNSMDGLIDQARQQLWNVVDEFSRSKKQGVVPALEVAVFEYGNDRLSPDVGFTRKVLGFTSELDRVSEALFSLTTNGGSEFCGYAINSALDKLQWSTDSNDLKTIFIAGNEPFTQGPTSYKTAIKNATKRSVVVNTIHAGPYDTGLAEGWNQAAVLAGGNYMSIDHNQQIAHIIAPQDKRISELNAQLNETYIPYGKEGKKSAARQIKQDQQSSSISLGLMSKRAKSKVSNLYDNATWDLVDAEEKTGIDIATIETESLPAVMQTMNNNEKKAYVKKKAKKRAEIKNEIVALHKQRSVYVAKKQSESASEIGATLKEAIVGSIRNQGKTKGFEFEE